MSATDISAPLLLSSNNENITKQHQLQQMNLNVESNSRLRAFICGSLSIILVTFFVTIAIMYKSLLFTEVHQPQGFIEHTEYMFLDFIAYFGFGAHLIVCVSWLMILLVLIVTGTPVSGTRNNSSLTAIIFLGGLFYGMTLVATMIQVYILQQNDDYTPTHFGFAVLGSIIHEGILLYAMYDTFRIKEVDTTDVEDSMETAADNEVFGEHVQNDYYTAMIV